MQYNTNFYDLHIFKTHSVMETMTGETIYIDPQTHDVTLESKNLNRFWLSWEGFKAWAHETGENHYIYNYIDELEELSSKFWQLREHIDKLKEA